MCFDFFGVLPQHVNRAHMTYKQIFAKLLYNYIVCWADQSVFLISYSINRIMRAINMFQIILANACLLIVLVRLMPNQSVCPKVSNVFVCGFFFFSQQSYEVICMLYTLNVSFIFLAPLILFSFYSKIRQRCAVTWNHICTLQYHILDLLLF